MAGVREMHSYLVGAAGKEPDLEQARIAALLRHFHIGSGALAALTDAHAPLSATRYIFVQRLADFEALLARHALDDGGVDLLDLALAQLAVQLDQRATPLAQDQQPGRIAVEAMGELEELGLRPAGAK